MNKGTIKKYLELEDLINPKYSYSDEWSFKSYRCDPLILNSLKENKKDLFAEFLQKYFVTPINNNYPRVYPYTPNIISSEFYSSKERKLYFSYPDFLAHILNGIITDKDLNELINVANNTENPEEKTEKLIDGIRTTMRKYSNVNDNQERSRYYNELKSIYDESYKDINNRASFKTFVTINLDVCKMILTGNSKGYHKEIFEVPLNSQELVECFDYDEFFLSAAASALFACKQNEELKKPICGCISFLDQYAYAVEKLREEDPNYDVSITVQEKDIPRKVSCNDVLIEYRRIVAKHPEKISISADNHLVKKMVQVFIKNGLTDFRDPNIRIRFEKALKTAYIKKKIKLDYEFIPRGKKLISEQKENTETIELTKINALRKFNDDEKIEKMLKCRAYLDSTDWININKGKGKFAGYVAYEYSNEIIILEMFYENDKELKVADERATYVMSLDDFYIFIEMTKAEITEKYKKGARGRKIFHDKRNGLKRWMSEIKREIEGSVYDDELESIIYEVLNEPILEYQIEGDYNAK